MLLIIGLLFLSLALTPPATPPHQMWRPLAPVALLGKSKAAEASKSSPSKVIQIEARPLPSVKARSRPTPAAATVSSEVACLDHDYCLPNKSTGEPGKRWNVKQQSFITIKPIKPAATTTQTPTAALISSAQSTTNAAGATKTQYVPLTKPLDHRPEGMEESSVLETPDASPAREETEVKETSSRRGPFGRSYRQHGASRTPSPRSSPKERSAGRSRKRRSHRSPSPMSSSSESDSHSSRSRSRSHSPSKKRLDCQSRPSSSSYSVGFNFLLFITGMSSYFLFRYRRCLSRSSSSSSSCSSSRSSPSVSRSPPRRRRYSYSSSRSGSWSCSRSRSRSPQRQSQWGSSRTLYRYSISFILIKNIFYSFNLTLIFG